jgi:hypothetical protein
VRTSATRHSWFSPWPPALLVGLAWLLRYAHDVGFARAPEWVGWFDQSRYIASARALARFDLDAGQHWYPPAYALTAAPFAWITPAQPYLIADLILVTLAAAAFARAMRPLGIGPWLAAAIFAASTLAIPLAANLWIEPWTTTLSAALLWGLFAVMAMLLDTDRPPPTGLLIAAGALAAAPALARPADAPAGVAALAVAAVVAYRRGLLTRRVIGLVLAGGLIVALPYAVLYLAIYGPELSGYIISGKNQGFAFDDLPWKAYVLLVAARPWFPGTRALIEVVPFLLPGLAGLIALAITGTAAERRMLALIAAVGLPLLAVQLTYTDFQPPGMWLYHNAHYLKWLFPLGGAGLWLWLRAFGRWRDWAVTMATTLALLALVCIRPLPQAVGDDRPARMLLFQGNVLRFPGEALFASVVVRDALGTMRNIHGFHQVPDDRGEREITITRLFTGPAERFDPGEPPPYNVWQKPYARYAVRLSFGWPCWSARLACQLPR